MHTIERRKRRGSSAGEALELQLAACCEDGRIEAMVIADDQGLPLASSGDGGGGGGVAARRGVVAHRVRELGGTLLGPGAAWNVAMRKIEIDGADLLVCAVGGTPEARADQVARSAEGALRILALA